MRWDELFADLQAQFAATATAQAHLEVAELAEAEMAATTLSDRWRAKRRQELWLRLRDGTDRTGTVADVAQEWIVLAAGPRRTLIPRHAVVLARPLGHSAPPPSRVESALGLGHVLRAMAQEQLDVVVHTVAGIYRGRFTRVGGDHCDVVTGSTVATIAWSGLITVESGA